MFKWRGLLATGMLLALMVPFVRAQDDGPDWVPGLIPAADAPGVLDKVLAQVDASLTAQTLLLEETFDTPDAWEVFSDSDSELAVANGRYRIAQGPGGTLLWGQNTTSHDDVAIEVQTEQLSSEPNNAYGVMCRANPANNGDGYYFNISGDGHYNIRVSQDGAFTELQTWTRSPLINTGQSLNRILAICHQDTLALYINGVLVSTVRDGTYASGVAGLAAFSLATSAPVEIAFDNLRIWSVQADAAPVRFPRGALLLEETFDRPDAWEIFSDSDSELAVANGRYRIAQGPGGTLLWGQNTTLHADVVIEVEAEQLSSEPNNAYGVMCRANPANNGDGYYFYVSGTGDYRIVARQGGENTILRDWSPDPNIRRGQATNRIAAVCVGDTLALFINDVLVAEVRDTTFAEGVAGLAAFSRNVDAPVEIAFDNLRLWQAEPPNLD